MQAARQYQTSSRERVLPAAMVQLSRKLRERHHPPPRQDPRMMPAQDMAATTSRLAPPPTSARSRRAGSPTRILYHPPRRSEVR
jgi:hypothetical protein